MTVNFATSNHTALVGSDYFAANGSLTFAPNETAKLVQISIINDFIAESPEDFYLTLSAASNAMITTAKSTITIVDDDCHAWSRLHASYHYDADLPSGN